MVLGIKKKSKLAYSTMKTFKNDALQEAVNIYREFKGTN